MNGKQLAISLIAVILAAGGGFFIANSINRAEMDGLRAENEGLKRSVAESRKEAAEVTLSDEEIRTRISEADANPANIRFNRDLGLALYRYAAMKRDVALLKESIRLLERVKASSGRDHDVLVGLGNAHFDVATFAEENDRFRTARSIYLEALEIKPGDANVRTDIALTYFLEDPPKLDQAASEFERALKEDPRNERALRFLAQAYAKTGKREEASAVLEKIRAINPSNPAVAEIESMLQGPSNNQ